MRAPLALVLVVALAGCGSSSGDEPAAATPQPEATASAVSVLGVQASVTPARAGTPERPQGIVLSLALELDSPRDVAPPLATRADVTLPEGAVYGGAVPACPLATLERKGPGGCPEGAIVGRGSALADADTSRSKGTITVVNGGAGRVHLFTTLTNPVRVQSVIVGTVRDGRLRLTFPEELQVVAGVPLALRELRVKAGRGDWLATTACPDGGAWTVDAAVAFDDGTTAEHTEKVPCER